MSLLEQLQTSQSPGPFHEGASPLPAGTTPAVRLIAYYLPQFHPIPENDAWWGRGFTEWTNVSKAVPRFAGHYQPQLPGELGFYDLRLAEVLRRQAELARGHGIEGFCFHYYWFAGRKLLDTPLEMLLADKSIDLPFCINWANENWTRRWDGNDGEVLIAQDYSPQDDMRFAEELARLVRDPRYIHVDGRPLVMLYRPGLLPDAAATVQRWRTHLVAAGLGDPLVIMPLVLGTDDPRSMGLDGAAGFPPHRNGFGAAPINKELELLDPEYRGTVVRYTDMMETALADHPTQFRYFPGVCPGWDNEARKPGRGFCVHGATPDAYEHWLAAACRRMLGAENPQERIVFINAWNEWAEGAHLEPDRHHGYAYLARTAKVAGSLAGLSPDVLRAQVQPVAEPVRPRRRARDIPGLVRKNLAYQGAKMAEALARRLRRLM